MATVNADWGLRHIFSTPYRTKFSFARRKTTDVMKNDTIGFKMVLAMADGQWWYGIGTPGTPGFLFASLVNRLRYIATPAISSLSHRRRLKQRGAAGQFLLKGSSLRYPSRSLCACVVKFPLYYISEKKKSPAIFWDSWKFLYTTTQSVTGRSLYRRNGTLVSFRKL